MYALYVSPMGAGSDMSKVVTGLVTELNNAGLKTVSFKPIGGGVTSEVAAQLLSTGGNDQLMEDIISGRMIFFSFTQPVAPSMLAASIISSLSPMKPAT